MPFISRSDSNGGMRKTKSANNAIKTNTSTLTLIKPSPMDKTVGTRPPISSVSCARKSMFWPSRRENFKPTGMITLSRMPPPINMEIKNIHWDQRRLDCSRVYKP